MSALTLFDSGATWEPPTPTLGYGSIFFTGSTVKLKKSDGTVVNVNTGAFAFTNTGTGAKVLKDGTTAIYRTLSAGTLMSITQNTDDITIAVNDAPNDANAYGRKAGAWTAMSWGVFTGTLSNQTDLWGALQARQSSSTSLFSGGQLSVNAGNNTKIDIAAGTALFIDFTSITAPTSQVVNFGPIAALTITNIATQNVTYIGIDATSTIIQQANPFTAAQRRTIVPLGVAVHSNRTIVNAVNQLGTPNRGALNQLFDMMDAIGGLNTTGNVYTANGANLSLNKSAGTLFKRGANFQNDPNDPHNIAIGAQTLLTFRYRQANGTEGADRTAIDPTQWDNAGTLTAVSAGQFTIQRVYLFQSGITRIQYGQAVYGTLSDAIAAITTEAFVEEGNIATNSTARACIIVKGNATDLTASNQAAIVNINKFGSSATSAPLSANLAAISTLSTGADQIDYWTGSGTAALTSLTPFARTILDDVDASTARGTLGLGSIATQASSAVTITGGTVDGTTIGATTPAAIIGTTISATGQIKAADGSQGAPSYTFTSDATSGIYKAASTVRFTYGASDSFGYSNSLFLIGSFSNPQVLGANARYQIHGGSATGAVGQVCRWSADATGPTWILSKSRGAGVGTMTALSASDSLGRLVWVGADGTNMAGYGAAIEAFAEGAYSNTSHPTRLDFSTCASSSTTPAIALRIDGTGNVRVINPNAGLGYGTGAGGTVTQATDKTTGVTLNKPSGQITMAATALASGATVSFAFSNSLVASTADQIFVQGYNSVSQLNYQIWAANNGVGQFNIYIKNISAGSLSEAVVINFTLLKGATA